MKKVFIIFFIISRIQCQESCVRLPDVPEGVCSLIKDCPFLNTLAGDIPPRDFFSRFGGCGRRDGNQRFCCPLQTSSDNANGQSEQCSQITIKGEENGVYRGQFSATSNSTFEGLTLEFIFNNDVNTLEFSAGNVERIDNRRFRLLSPGWMAQPGWTIDFDFTPHFSGNKPIVTQVIMNEAEICRKSIQMSAKCQTQQCSQISIREEGNGQYRGHFSATSSSTFEGLTLEFTFNNDVNSLEFSAGYVEMIDKRRFRLLSPGWVAQPGWNIHFDFTPHFSGNRPIVTQVIMNSDAICTGCPDEAMG